MTFTLETEQERLPTLYPHPVLPPGLGGQGLRSHLCFRNVGLAGQPPSASSPGTASLLLSAGWRGGLVAGPAPCSQTRSPPPARPASLSQPCPLSSGSTSCVLLSPFCRVLPPVDSHQPSFAAESFLELPRPTQETPSFLVFEESGGQRLEGHL